VWLRESDDSRTNNLPAAVSSTFRVDRSNNLTPIFLSSQATLLVRDGGAMPSFFEALIKLPSCAMMTIRMLTSNGFLLCMETCLYGYAAFALKAL
jgi:hypothetical protein